MDEQTNKKQGKVLPRYDKVFVFLGYYREEAESIGAIKKFLVREGVPDENVFLDTSSIQGGEEWRRKIIEAIKNATLCIFFWTNNMIDSEMVETERKHAQQEQKFYDSLNLVRYKKYPRQFHVIDVIPEDMLHPILRNRFEDEGYDERQYVKFDDRQDFDINFEEKMKKNLPDLEEIHNLQKEHEQKKEEQRKKDRKEYKERFEEEKKKKSDKD